MTHSPDPKLVEAAARTAAEIAPKLSELIEAHLECGRRNYVGRLGNLTEFLWDNKVSILRALQALPLIRAAALEEAAKEMENMASEAENDERPIDAGAHYRGAERLRSLITPTQEREGG